MPNILYMLQIGVSNPNVPIFPPRVCTLVLFIDSVAIIDLKSDLPAYLTAANVPEDVDVLQWWKSHADTLPKWSTVNSMPFDFIGATFFAAAKQVFCLLSNSFDSQQESAFGRLGTNFSHATV